MPIIIMNFSEFKTGVWDRVARVRSPLEHARMYADGLDEELQQHLDEAITAVLNAQNRCFELTRIPTSPVAINKGE